MEPLHLYVKETVPPVTTPSTTPSVPDTTVVLEGNSLKTLQLFVLEGNSPNKIIFYMQIICSNTYPVDLSLVLSKIGIYVHFLLDIIMFRTMRPKSVGYSFEKRSSCMILQSDLKKKTILICRDIFRRCYIRRPCTNSAGNFSNPNHRMIILNTNLTLVILNCLISYKR